MTTGRDRNPDAAVMSRIYTITNIGNLVKRRDCRTKERRTQHARSIRAAVTQAVRDLCIQANTQLTGDVCQAIRQARGQERPR